AIPSDDTANRTSVPPNHASWRRIMRLLIAVCATALAALAVPALAETKVTVSGTHLCCGACIKAVDTTLKDLAVAKVKSDQAAKTIEITAENDEAAQKAIDALANAGFYGKLDNDKIKYKPVSSGSAAVEKVEVSGIHNCCGQCTSAISKAVKSVSG